MANNTGLKFNPFTSFAAWNDQIYNNTVPTTAADYFNPQKPKKQDFADIKWDPMRLSKAQNFVNQVVNGEIEEWHPFEEYNKWQHGTNGLGTEELKTWRLQNANKIKGHNQDWIDRLWKNQEFVKKYGMEAFQSHNAKERDAIFENGLLDDAVATKFGNNDNLMQLLSLTPAGKKQLLESDYKADWQLKKDDSDAKDKKWSDYTLEERWNAISSSVPSYALAGTGVGSLIGAAVAGVGSIPGAVIGAIAGAGTGLVSGIINPEDAASENAYKRRKENEETLNKIQIADNERKKEESKDDISNLYNLYLRQYTNGELTKEKIDDTFNDIALSGKRTPKNPNEIGEINEYDYVGSSYYSAFKDTDEFKDFDALDKLKYIAQTQVIANKYGQGSAIQMLDQDMQQYVSDQQTGWTWLGNTGKNIWVGGVANLFMNLNALQALAAQLTYGDKGLAEYLKGRDASGSGEENSWINNPAYWNKVDQYNTFGWDHWYNPFSYNEENMKAPERNGGISIYNNVYTPGDEGSFTSWSTLNEALKMSKFAWSDALKNIGLAKLVGAAVKATGGTQLAPGVLATESSAVSKGINYWGSVGVLNASSLGIDAAYGMQTYEEVLRANNERLDKIIEKDVEEEVQKRLDTPQAKEEFRRYVDAENERRKRQAGERGSYIGVDEDQAFLDYTEHLRRIVRPEIEKKHTEDRQQAESDAANAYAVDASIEHLRMASTNAAFRSYLFDKGTLNALRKNNPYVNVTTKDGAYAVGKHAVRNTALKTALTNIWGGFHSNYFDDVTVGYAKAFGIQDFNNYLYQKYNPAAYGNVIDDFVSPWVAGIAGAEDAMTERRSLLDGFIGALGSGFTFTPNIGGMINYRENMKQLAESNKKRGLEKEGISWAEYANNFVTNPIIQAIADANSRTRMTKAEVKRVNDIIKENGYSLDNITEVASALNNKEGTRQGVSVLDAEDAKDREAFTLASTLLTLKNSGVVANAQAEPSRAAWSKKKKAADMIGRGLNALVGRNMFVPAESSFTNAMRALNDAATIGESNDAETQERQVELIETFLGLDANKNVLSEMSEEEQTAFAKERLKKNAGQLLDIMDKTEKLQKNFENSVSAFAPDVQQQIMFQHVMDSRWKSRKQDMEHWITKDDEFDGTTEDSPLIAKYGSMAGYERARKKQEKAVEEAQKDYDDAALSLKKDVNPYLSMMENMRLNKINRMWEKAAKKILKRENAKLKDIIADKEKLETVLSSETPTISAENILRLNANDRLRMLDDFYRSDYTEAQQAEIDKAKSMLIEDGTTMNDAMEKVKDAAVLQNRINDNMEAAKRIMQDPLGASDMYNALLNNRRKAIRNYFNDKVVAEAYADLLSDASAMLNQDAIEKKVQEHSTAVLDGMKSIVQKELKNPKKVLSDKTLTDIQDGINAILKQREENKKETTDLTKYIEKTKKVNHTETVERPLINGNTGEVEEGTGIVDRVTTEKEISNNDRKLLNLALDYAAERDIPVEKLPQEVATESFEDYAREIEHTDLIENRADLVSPQYRTSLLEDVLKAFNEHKEKVDEVKSEKPVAEKPKSVATTPVEPKGEKPATREEQAKEGEKEIDVKKLFNIEKKDEEKAPDSKEGLSDKDAEILDDAASLNSRISGDLSTLLRELNKMPMDEKTRDKLKELIQANIPSSSTITELQNKVMADAFLVPNTEAPQITAKATSLANINIESVKKRGSEKKADEKAEDEKSIFPSDKIQLETLDLDEIIDNPKYAALSDFVKMHGIVSFLQRLSDFWKSDRENAHKNQVAFIYDPTLASKVEEGIKKSGGTYYPEKSAPVIMALEITERNKHLVADKSTLIEIQDVPNGRSRLYQPLGIMPANTNTKMQSTAQWMSEIRDRIVYTNKKGEPATKPSIIRVDNGNSIHCNIDDVSSHTDPDARPYATENTPKKSALQLLDENVSSPTESIVKVSEAEKREYEEAKKKGLKALRGTNLYKKAVAEFIKRIFKKEEPSSKEDEKPRKNIYFNVQKGTHDRYPRIVLTKKISETTDKNTGRPIKDMLVEKDNSVIYSNSRLSALFKALSDLKLQSGLFNQNGDIVNKTAYKSAISAFEKSVEHAISNSLDVVDMHVRVNVSEGAPSEKTVNIQIYSGDINDSNSLLSTLTTKYRGSLSEEEYVSFLRDLILDEEGNPRPNPRYPEYEKVKWQVNYTDAETANGRSEDGSPITSERQENAVRNLKQLFDDGVFEMQLTKLAYPARSVRVGTSGGNLKTIYKKRAPQKPVQSPTETKSADEVETARGKMDADTGMPTETLSREELLKIPAVQKTMKIVEKMISDSSRRDLTPDGAYYSIGNQIYARVTSLKYAIRDGLRKFTNDPTKVAPAPLIGNSFDDFGRDAINKIFDSMSEEARMEVFGTYPNATAKNYADAYVAMKGLEARLLERGQVLLSTGDSMKNRGKITAKGSLNVKVKNADGTFSTREIRVAGTIDAIAVDRNGDLHIYDFKTHRVEYPLTRDEAINNGYDIQQSEYAEFLEEEYKLKDEGISIKTVNIIPVGAKYPSRSNHIFEETNVQNQLKVARVGDTINGEPRFINLEADIFSVEKEFEIPRLSKEALTASYDKLSEEDKKALVEIIRDQSEDPSSTSEIKPSDVVAAEPELSKTEEEEEEEGGRPKRKGIGRRINSVRQPTTQEAPVEEALKAVDSESKTGFLNKVEELKNNCGGRKNK
jgi:hypothetical protein